jgi:hypothetical protein
MRHLLFQLWNMSGEHSAVIHAMANCVGISIIVRHAVFHFEGCKRGRTPERAFERVRTKIRTTDEEPEEHDLRNPIKIQ